MSRDWRVGLERLAPGVYCDDKGTLHLDECELLEASGFAPNEHNREMIRKAMRELAGEKPFHFVED